MLLTKFFAVFAVLIGRICLGKITTDTSNQEEFAELETTAIRFLENCYANRDKSIALSGDFPGNFIKKLSVNQNFAIVLLDRRRRAENTVNYWDDVTRKPMHQVHVLVTIAPFIERAASNLQAFAYSRYYSTAAFVLMLAWSPKIKYGGCADEHQFQMLRIAFRKDLQYVNLICRHSTEGIVVYSVNGFRNYAPKPWQFLWSTKMVGVKNVMAFFKREYRDDDSVCKNLFFDKTRDLNGAPITLILICEEPPCQGELVKGYEDNRLLRIEQEKHLGHIREFITIVNATQVPIWKIRKVGERNIIDLNHFYTPPTHMRGVGFGSTFSHPYNSQCKYLITQYRGNKSQLKKIYDTIDSYSWVGMWIVYMITLIFFKYFMRQTLIEALVNLSRLTCSFGLTTTPRDLASQIYLSCLLFFVVTMLGIFTGNLASMLTHDTPVRQVNSISDLVDLKYSVRADYYDFKQLKDAGFNGRLMEKLTNERCVEYVKRDSSIACLTWGVIDRIDATNSKLYISSGCVAREYLVSVLPWKWSVEETFNKILLIRIGGGITTDLDVLVDEKRLLEADAEEVDLPPVIMTFDNLAFAFAIYGIGLGCAIISFIVEIMDYRFQRRVTTTQVIVLK